MSIVGCNRLFIPISFEGKDPTKSSLQSIYEVPQPTLLCKSWDLSHMQQINKTLGVYVYHIAHHILIMIPRLYTLKCSLGTWHMYAGAPYRDLDLWLVDSV